MKILPVLLLLVFTINIQAQKADTIWFLNGERLITSNYSINVEDGILTYQVKKNKMRQVGLEFVFSVVDSNNNEKVYFEPTTIEKRYYSVEDMRNFIKGEYTAHQQYHSPFPIISGVVTGAGSVYAVPSLLGLNVFFAPLVPAANSAIIGTFNYKEAKVKKMYPQHSDNPYFIAGYREVVTQKRITNTIKGGLIGLGLGVVSAVLINQLQK
ncbi:MAG: hypothetical protein N2449_02770 [Bacteroidales bacterium]|nr:hypothetical protein [Bacteroidales bacterium]